MVTSAWRDSFSSSELVSRTMGSASRRASAMTAPASA
ncbi:hypothetical protein FHS63_005084 [Azospirillum doebereinerae]